MLRHYKPSNLFIMDAIQKKELLHLRIEQANEQLLDVLAKMAETLFQTYQPEVIEGEIFVAENEEETGKMTAYEATLKPMNKADFYEQINDGIEEYKRGESLTLEEVE